MTRREVLERRRRRRRIRMIRKSIKIGVYTLLAVALVFVVWKFASPLIKKGNDKKPIEVQAEVPDPGDAARTAYSGSGAAGGWNVDDTGWWYLNGDNTYYANGWQTIEGQKYYFNEGGYMATGWVDINGDSHFFTVSGTEDPDAKQKLVAVTYDDGPSGHTERLLDCLEANGAKATFFVVGTQVEQYPDTLKREDELGMEIGSHTYSHPWLNKLDAAGIEDALQKNEDVIKGIIGHGTSLMRPTGGGISDTMREIIKVPMINWDVDTLDWKTKDTQNTVDTILSDVKDGSIILMHDLYEPTVAASEIIIPELIKQGYKLVTVSELAEKRGITLEGGKDYYDFYPPEGSAVGEPEEEEPTAEEPADEEPKDEEPTEEEPTDEEPAA